MNVSKPTRNVRRRGSKRQRPIDLPANISESVRVMADGIYNKTIEEMRYTHKARAFVPQGTEVTDKTIELGHKKFGSGRFNQLVKNGICEVGVDALSRVREVTHNFAYKHKLRPDDDPDHEIYLTDQGHSGRCWMFAALNFVRRKLISQYQLKGGFELSESYLFWADKIERANLLWTMVINMREKGKIDTNDDRLRCYQEQISSDGGTWSFFVELIQKYGIMPKSVWGETVNSYYSNELNDHWIRYMLSKVAEINNQKTFNKKRLTELKDTVWVPEVISMMNKFIGKPPAKFDWITHNRHDKVISHLNMTPDLFYHAIVEPLAQLDTKVVLVHDPRNTSCKSRIPVGQTAVAGCNMVGRLPSMVHSVKMDDMLKATKNAIGAEDAVWFACDVGTHFDYENGVFDMKAFDYKSALSEYSKFTASDSFSLVYNAPTHAMLFVGYSDPVEESDDYDADRNDKEMQFRVENSWGYTHWNDSGYQLMKENWFRSNVYMVVVDRAHVPPGTWKTISKNRHNPIVLKYNDPFGFVAKKCQSCNHRAPHIRAVADGLYFQKRTKRRRM